jgi:hypothetical protein
MHVMHGLRRLPRARLRRQAEARAGEASPAILFPVCCRSPETRLRRARRPHRPCIVFGPCQCVRNAENGRRRHSSTLRHPPPCSRHLRKPTVSPCPSSIPSVAYLRPRHRSLAAADRNTAMPRSSQMRTACAVGCPSSGCMRAEHMHGQQAGGPLAPAWRATSPHSNGSVSRAAASLPGRIWRGPVIPDPLFFFFVYKTASKLLPSF